MICETYEDGSTVSYTYDAFGRMSQQVTKHGDAENGTTVLTEAATFKDPSGSTTSSQIVSYNGFTYTYDTNGNILSVSDGTYTTTYEYDSANQLVRENNQQLGITQTWTYDNAGNILSRKEYDYTTASNLTNVPYNDYIQYSYDDPYWGDLLTGYAGDQLEYDEIGNLVDDAVWEYTWQHGRQLASMEKADGTKWEYTYNSDGMRIKRTDGTSTYNYIYNGSQLTQMTVGDNTLTFTYDATSTPLTVTYGNTVYYYVVNLQGDVIAILNTDKYSVVEYVYDAWGNVCSISGDLADTLGLLNPLRYRGYVYDTETELYYLQSRYYNPEIGRFINGDEFPSTGQSFTGNNMFAYCGNNPISRGDTTGQSWGWVIGLIVAAITAQDIYQIVREDEKRVEAVRDGDTVKLENSSNIVSPWVMYGYSFYLNHFSEHSEFFQGTTTGIAFEWAVHNIGYAATSIADTGLKRAGIDSPWIEEQQVKFKDTDFQTTIYDDNHGVATVIMGIGYTILSPRSATMDIVACIIN